MKLSDLKGMPKKKGHRKYPICSDYGGYDCNCGVDIYNQAIDAIGSLELVGCEDKLYKLIETHFGDRADMDVMVSTRELARQIIKEMSAWIELKENKG